MLWGRRWGEVSPSLNSLKGGYIGDYIGDYNSIGVIKGDTRNLDYNPYNPLCNPSFHFIFHFLFHLIFHYKGGS